MLYTLNIYNFNFFVNYTSIKLGEKIKPQSTNPSWP